MLLAGPGKNKVFLSKSQKFRITSHKEINVTMSQYLLKINAVKNKSFSLFFL